MDNEALTPVAPTEDMKLPEGSAVFQIILNTETGELDMRGVLIGGPDGTPPAYNPFNPAHRLLAVLNNHMNELVAEALAGAEVVRTDGEVIERRLHEGEVPGALPEEGVDLSDQAQQELAQQQQRQADKAGTLALQYGHSGNPADPGFGDDLKPDADAVERASWPFTPAGDK